MIEQEVTVPLIRAKAHNIYSILSRKVGLSCNDTKRFVLADNIHTLAFGHYRTPEARSDMAAHLRIKRLEAKFRKMLDDSDYEGDSESEVEEDEDLQSSSSESEGENAHEDLEEEIDNEIEQDERMELDE